MTCPGELDFVNPEREPRYLIDPHPDATGDDVWNVFREVNVLCDIKGAILERDGDFPNFDELVGEL